MTTEQAEFVFTHDKTRSEEKADALLRLVTRGPRLTSELVVALGHRFSIYVQLLSDKGHVFRKEKVNGECLYTHVGFSERIEVADDMKAAYYKTEHWVAKRLERLRFDTFACAWCHASQNLHVHHWHYDLFAESIEDLMTLCKPCHDRMHENNAIKVHFPHYVTPEIAIRLTT